jgi:hypothetical protein
MKKYLAFISLIWCGFNNAQGQTYFLNGSAIALGDDCYQLTPALNTQNGTVWYGDQIDLLQSFDLLFYMNYGSFDGNGADGICFVLQTVGTNAIGESGGGMGYLNFGTSLGIEFDTWQNGENSDPVEDHVAIERDGSINHSSPLNLAGPVSIDPLGINVEDGQDHLVRINWDPVQQIIRVYYECEFRLSATIDMINEIFGGQNLVYWGFTAATGGASNNQIVCLEENILASQDEVYTCPGLPVQLSAGAGGGVYSWSPSTGLDDPTIATPIAQVDETTVYTVEYTDACGIPGTAQITVFVEPLIATTEETATLNCHNPTLEILGTANFPAQFLSWTWSSDDGNILNGAQTSSPSVDAPGEYMYIISYEGFCADTGYVEVGSDYSDFSITIPDASLLNCINNSLSLFVEADPANGVTYTWSTIDGNITSGTNAEAITLNAPGEYFVQVYLNEFCNDGSSYLVEANYDVSTITFNNPQEVNCNNAEVVVSVQTNPTSDEFSWLASGGGVIESGQGTSSIEVSQAGTYQVTVLHPVSGCGSVAEIEVSENFVEPELDFIVTDTLDCLHPIISLSVSPGGDNSISYNWSASSGGNIVAGASAAVVSVDQPGDYSVILTDTDNGCTSTAAAEVIEDELFNIDLSTIAFPNVFTPDGNEKNRGWRPFLRDDPSFDLTQVFNAYSLEVYNRWGTLIFESTDGQRTWLDREAETGVYYYIVSYESLCGTGAKAETDGYIHLMK